MPPLSLCGPVLNVRKFSSVPLGPSDLLEHGTIGPRMLGFLAACVRGRMNIVISGGTSSGKTTLLGVLSSFVHGTVCPEATPDGARSWWEQTRRRRTAA